MDFSAKADLLMFGSGYPHWSTSSAAEVSAGLDSTQREKVLWRNASALYGITVSETESSLS
jgi:predicted TIM-barrel fold metal-dependent hydrolase